MITASRKQILSAAAVLLVVPSLVWGSGFSLFEHGNRAMAMGGAFVAVADDPSALFWNPAGIAFQTDKGPQVMNGVTFISLAQDFTGENPYPGAGYTASQKSQTFFPPHIYAVLPINSDISFGLGLFVPFGLGTWWDEDFAGRYISKRIDLKTYAVSPSIAFKVGSNFAFALGVDYLIGQIDLTKDVAGVDPYTQQVVPIGQAHLSTYELRSDGWGYHGSGLATFGDFSLGVLYRSKIKVKHSGTGSFTQHLTGHADYDAMVAGLLPFNHNLAMTAQVEFPDYLAIGAAWTTDKLTVSAQYAEMGWSSFQELAINFVDSPMFSSVVEENYEDADQYRFGMEYRMSPTWAFQAGYLVDKTPQPVESMSPMLADGDREGYSLGLSWVHNNLRVDVGELILDLEDRCTGGQSLDDYEGCYHGGSANLFGLTLTLTF